MTTTHRDVLDPEAIRETLPTGEQARFLAEYRSAAEKATHDPTQWGELRELLHTWRLRAHARQSPGYYQAREQARRREGPTTTLDDIIARRGGGA